MTTLMQASRQWATRPADERYASLLDMQSTMTGRRERSRATVESTRALTVLPDESDPQHRGLYLGLERGPLAGQLLAPTHQAFGQICSLAATPSPASYFRESRVPADIIADALNYNLSFTREAEDIGVLATLGDEDNSLGVPAGSELRAATGPAYGRIWDADIVDGACRALWRRCLGALACAGRVRQPHHGLEGEHDFVRERSRHVRVPGRRRPAHRRSRPSQRFGLDGPRVLCLELRDRRQDARPRVLPVRLRLLEPHRVGCGPIYRGPHPPHQRR